MKKIKNTRQLQKERKRLKQREAELNHQINSGWRDLKGLLNPCSLFRQQERKHRENQHLLKSIVTYVVSTLTAKLIKKVGEKTEQFFS